MSALPDTTVLIVDDDPLVRSSLRLLLGRPTLTVVGEAADGTQAQRLVGELHPDIVLMDIRMPSVDGLSATEAIMSQPSPPQIIILTTFHADEQVLRALRLGAAGFLLKDTPPEELIRAIHRVAAGDAQLSPAVLRQVIRTATDGHSRTKHAHDRLAVLTERELEIAHGLGVGMSNAQIGAKLYLSVPTVKAYVSTIMQKLGVANRVQVALIANDVENSHEMPPES